MRRWANTELMLLKEPLHFRGVVLKPQNWSKKKLNWDTGAFLFTDYDFVSIFSKKNTEICKKRP